MNHKECINTPFDRIYTLITELEEQKIIELDFFRTAILSAVGSLFTKNSESMYSMFLKEKNKSSKNTEEDDKEFMEFLNKLKETRNVGEPR